MESPANIHSRQNCLHANLRKATRAISKYYSDLLEPTEFERTQFTLMSFIALVPEPTISKLAQALVMDQTTVTRNVQGLVRKGFVQLEKGLDKRMRYVTITSEGEAAMAVAIPYWQTAQTGLVDALGAEKASQLLDLLDELVAITND